MHLLKSSVLDQYLLQSYFMLINHSKDKPTTQASQDFILSWLGLIDFMSCSPIDFYFLWG